MQDTAQNVPHNFSVATMSFLPALRRVRAHTHLFKSYNTGAASIQVALQGLCTLGMLPCLALCALQGSFVRLLPPESLVVGSLECRLQLLRIFPRLHATPHSHTAA